MWRWWVTNKVLVWQKMLIKYFYWHIHRKNKHNMVNSINHALEKSVQLFCLWQIFNIVPRMNVFASKFVSFPNSWFKLSYIFNNFFPIIFSKHFQQFMIYTCVKLFFKLMIQTVNCCIFLITFVQLFLSKHFQQFMIYTCVKLHLEAIFKDICIDRRLPSNFKTASSEYYLFSEDRNMHMIKNRKISC